MIGRRNSKGVVKEKIINADVGMSENRKRS